jgi:hypothetical protein
MKKISLLLVALIILRSIYGQTDTNNFKIIDGDIIWQKIYETTMSKDTLLSLFESSGLFTRIEVSKQFMGDLKKMDADIKGAGYDKMAVPMYIPNKYITGFLTVDFREGKYRVTIKNIKLIQKADYSLAEQGEETSLNTYAVKGDNEFKSAFLKAPSKIYNYTFEKAFAIKETDDNW